jgi:hypothetical protein
MPPGYVTYRKDRSDGYGVLVTVKDTLFSSEVDIETKSELIAVQIEGEGKLSLIGKLASPAIHIVDDLNFSYGLCMSLHRVCMCSMFLLG